MTDVSSEERSENRPLKIAVVGIPGQWSTETLADTVESRCGYRLVIDMGDVSVDLAEGALYFQDHNLSELDALIVKKISTHYSPDTLDRLELLRVAEHSGVRIFSRPSSILRLINRLSGTITLSNAGIPMPETRVTESIDQAVRAVESFGTAIFKPLFSTKARGMVMIDAADDPGTVLKQVRDFQIDNPVMYIQKRITLPGRDLGLVFLGGRYLGCYARVTSNKSWNTTIHSGGRYESYQPSDTVIDLAHQAQALFDMDYTTVDIAESEEGPVVFEVSAFGGFRGILEGSGVNAAERYLNYVLECLSL